jgi:hypothetical protein
MTPTTADVGSHTIYVTGSMYGESTTSSFQVIVKEKETINTGKNSTKEN